MISNKFINIIISIIMILSLLVASLIMILSNNTNYTSSTTEAEYISKIFDKNKVIEIDITISQEDWDWTIENATKEEYKNANISINGETYYNVGIRPKGNSSLSIIASNDTTDRYSFKIKFDEYVDGQTLHGLNKLVLNNIMSDTTYMKEYLSYDLYTAMGIPTPAYAYANIKINGENWGLYLAVEVIEESFLERNYGTLEGNLYKPESTKIGGDMPDSKQGENPNNAPDAAPNQRPNLNEKANLNEGPNREGNKQNPMGGGKGMGSSGGTNLVWNGDDPSNYSSVLDSAVLKKTTSSDHEKVINMIKNLNEGTDLEKYLDVDEILRYFAVNTFLVNLDSYAGSMKHNYYLYEENDIFQILPWDFNLSFAGFQMNDGKKAINFPIDSPVTDTLENSPLIAKLLEVSEYKELYHKYLNEIVTNYIDNGVFKSTINSLDNLIGNYVKNDATAFYTYEEYKTSLPILISFGKDRASSITAQLTGAQPSTTYGNIPTNVDLSALGTIGGGNGEFPGEKSPENNFPAKDNNSPNNFGNGNMPDMSTIEKAMEIIQASKDGILTDEQIAELKNLGIDESTIEIIKNSPFSMNGENGNKDFQDNLKKNPNISNRVQGSQTPENTSYLVTILIFALLSIIIASIFALKFKRRKYESS
ncbi:CotH kinase family protein [Clostridium butanoliproducens]|uniref:CotH kinase family protein n=1 Tax=Clostridium butanoliproducens TaxID=2991837 RepID=UPI0024BA6B5D|nr:CotH kinase family protein [Clostridium butanoliproducens]